MSIKGHERGCKQESTYFVPCHVDQGSLQSPAGGSLL